MRSNLKILITGADGFIGSHLTEELVRQGHKVRSFVLYNSFNSWGWLDSCSSDIKGKFEVFAGDIRDPHGVKEAMKGCDAVLHLAALIAIPYSYHSPDTYVDTNVKGTLNVLQAARELNVKRMVLRVKFMVQLVLFLLQKSTLYKGSRHIQQPRLPPIN
jgi:dTDP-glucose 4,6-dehydratase